MNNSTERKDYLRTAGSAVEPAVFSQYLCRRSSALTVNERKLSARDHQTWSELPGAVNNNEKPSVNRKKYGQYAKKRIE
jgi:hypothetical protein